MFAGQRDFWFAVLDPFGAGLTDQVFRRVVVGVGKQYPATADTGRFAIEQGALPEVGDVVQQAHDEETVKCLVFEWEREGRSGDQRPGARGGRRPQHRQRQITADHPKSSFFQQFAEAAGAARNVQDVAAEAAGKERLGDHLVFPPIGEASPPGGVVFLRVGACAALAAVAVEQFLIHVDGHPIICDVVMPSGLTLPGGRDKTFLSICPRHLTEGVRTVRRLRIGLAQINCTVGDFPGNLRKMTDALEKARAQGVELLAFPEMTIPGYPPEDLLLNPAFIRDNLKTLERFRPLTKGMTVVVGFVDRKGDIFNAAAVLHHGAVAGVYHKMFLPNYGVFDEERYFEVGHRYPVFHVGEVIVGVNICEDIWYPDGPMVVQTFGGGAELIVNISASPYHAGKAHTREQMLATRAKDNTAAVAYVNMVGGQDELVFDGQSLILNGDGEIVARGAAFEETLLVADLSLEMVFRARLHDPRRRNRTLKYGAEQGIEVVTLAPPTRRRKTTRPAPAVSTVSRLLAPLEEIYRALVLGVRDYVGKNGFHQAVIGLSGGVDSALTAAIAVDALGNENVIGVMMPSIYTSAQSQEDAKTLATRLAIRFMTIPISDLHAAYLKTLAPSFGQRRSDQTEENLQARIRGNFLMALSNKFGWLVLTTGNKSELSVGYTTLYGDMAGGFAVIKDVPKTLVYELARHRNGLGAPPCIPQRTMERPPTAELRPGQTDQDTLPPYEVLDPILQAYVEEDQSPEDIVAMGFKKDLVERVIAMVNDSEYKRLQAPPGIKITPRALGKDRRMPITNKYRPIGKKA